MRTVAWWLAGSLALVALGCSSGGSSPISPTTDNSPSLPTGNEAAYTNPGAAGSIAGIYQRGGIQEGAVAIYTMDIDAESLTATTHLKSTRSAQQNDDLFMLPLSELTFWHAGDFAVTKVSAAVDTIDIGYVVKHPFAAPSNLDGPIHALTNRADLGLAGMTLFLVNAPALDNTYFTDRVANTAMLANADAYYSPAGMVTLDVGVTANTFPYKQLVDETVTGTGNRVGVSNGGLITGNYGTDGWSRPEMESVVKNIGWTGYGVLHQGQAASNVASFNKAELGLGLSLDIVVIAKYNDPRGGANANEKKANRLPITVPDYQKLMYRMPHGSLDLGRITFVGQTGVFATNAISAATLDITVEDWDANGFPSPAADLSLDSVPTNVNADEDGAPTVVVNIPAFGVASAPIALVAGPETGAPGSELVYSGVVTKGDGGGLEVDDIYTGMIRATDVEDALPTALFLGLDKDLNPAVPQPKPVAYQAFQTELINPNAAPTATVSAPVLQVASGNGVLTLTVDPYNDGDGDPIDIRFDWNDDGDFADTGEAYQTLSGSPPDVFPSPVFYNNATGVLDVRNVPYEYTDNVIVSPVTGSAAFNLGPNQIPAIGAGTAPSLAVSSLVTPATFTMNPGTAVITDPEGDTISYTIQNTANANSINVTSPWAVGVTANTTPIAALGAVTFTTYVNDATHPTNTGVAFPTVVGTVTCPPCPPSGFVGTPVTTNFTGYTGSLSYFLTYWFGSDLGYFRNPARPGHILNTVPNTQDSSNLILSTVSGGVWSATQLTNWAAFDFQIPGMAIDIETDRTDRVFIASNNFGLTDTGHTAAGKYGATAVAAVPNIRWFDYTGVPYTAAINVISTGTDRVIAMTVTDAGDIYFIDQVSILHKYSKTSATTYAESIGCGWPANLGTTGTPLLPGAVQINPTGAGDANRKVSDIVYNENSRCIYLLAQSQQAVTLANPNAFLYRIECDGTYVNPVSGNANPKRFVLNTNTTQTLMSDIAIDNYNAAGVLLTGQQDSQMITGSVNTLAGDLQDIKIHGANLAVHTAGLDCSATGLAGGTASIMRQVGLNPVTNQIMFHTATFDAMGAFTTPPALWQ